MTWVYIWLGVFAISLIVEFISMELISIWITIGSLVSLILAFFNVPVIVQLIVFGVVTIACILGLRRFALKLFFRNKGKTNIDVIIGSTHRLIKETNEDELGSIKINGVEWSVLGENREKIEVGSLVEVIKVDGNKFIVKEVKSSTKAEKEENSKEIDVENSDKKSTKKVK